MPPDIDAHASTLVEAIPPDMRSAGKTLLLNTSAGVSIAGFTLNEWVAILTGIYFVAQIGLLCIRYSEEIPKLWRRWRGTRRGDA
ncbi:Uncharacterised protein [Bordetella ansorpii]|uniref:Holin n=1 Tax=Bordetella ansorpii TaxID=288768 RepID=A0A157QNQ7_9BORD|nr:hypothetical protein [Bordetella ansorpii]SAI47417.1 Uncharacterised protein [Bordetella ansorpii]